MKYMLTLRSALPFLGSFDEETFCDIPRVSEIHSHLDSGAASSLHQVAATPALAATHPAHVVVPDGFCGPSDLRITALNAEKPWVSPGGPAEAWRRLLCAWVLV